MSTFLLFCIDSIRIKIARSIYPSNNGVYFVGAELEHSANQYKSKKREQW